MEAAVPPPPPPKLKPPGAAPAPPPPKEKPDVGAAPGAGAVVFGAPKLNELPPPPPAPVDPPPNENAILSAGVFFVSEKSPKILMLLPYIVSRGREEGEGIMSQQRCLV